MYPYKDLLCSFLDDLASRSKNPCSNCKQEIEKNFLKSSIKVDVILQADYACGGGDLALPVVLRTVNFSVASCPVSTIWSGADVSDQIRQFKWVSLTGRMYISTGSLKINAWSVVKDAKIDQQESNKDVEVSQDDLEEEAGDQATESRGDQAKNYLVDKT